MAQAQRELARTLLSVIFLGALIVTSFWILRPFLAAAIWATMIVVATWPVMLWFQSRLWRRRSLAVGAMTLTLLLVFMVPLALAIGTLVLNAEEIVARMKSIASFRMPAPPGWLADLPYVGAKLALAWEQVAASGVEGLLARLTPYAGSVTRWFVTQAGDVGILFVQFLLTLVLAALMFASGEAAALTAARFGRRLAGERGENAVQLAGQAIRGVALGVVVTAVVQSGVGGLGLAIASVPLAGLLTAAMLFLCIAQVGPSAVLFPAVIWLYWTGETAWGTFLLVWSVIVVTMDNFLRPVLIKRGADLPLLLIFAGVIGGLLAFGLVGIFVGPVVLAVAYTLLEAWIDDGELDQ
ncbi:AI-2E family transporter YdiK [Aquabacterium sp. A7-Y]|uniref:AI-2E family transporter YdiK n=1 Tax=Aquabacterium sp. A7-Y TaxID=1349605 RepID=UPI00223E6754|nr:AI-2E family transporter YdiK [Aquabacterium sp. A7-Y]MCW7541155.1 AI-2E family transporter YdiK [Aquabacterium sp. A7-Y]